MQAVSPQILLILLMSLLLPWSAGQLSPEVCSAGWKENNKYYEDASCVKYPNDCEKMKPDPRQLDLMMKGISCQAFNREVMRQLKKSQELTTASFGKCMLDIILCYMTACMGTLNDLDRKEVLKKLEEFEKKLQKKERGK